MDYVIVCLVALLVSGLTLFSGFGLGTLLMPAFAFFFPLPVAVAATAVVHLSNNLFKVALLGKKADWGIVLRFGLPAVLAAIAGALLLEYLAEMPALFSWIWGGTQYPVGLVKLVMGVVIVLFALFELVPATANLQFDSKFLSLGGAVSGFFGGLSGHQGALRAAFLSRAGLEKEAFVATGTISAVLVDVFRLMVYGVAFYQSRLELSSSVWGLVAAATACAFVGSFVGVRLLKKVTMRLIQVIIGVLLVFTGLAMVAGLL